MMQSSEQSVIPHDLRENRAAHSTLHMSTTTQRKAALTRLPSPPSLVELERELAAVQAKQADVQSQIEGHKRDEAAAAETKAKLQELTSQFGVATIAEFATLVQRHALPVKPRIRFAVTEEKEAQIIAMLAEHKTGRQIKAATGLSLPTIQRVKADHGLIQYRPHLWKSKHRRDAAQSLKRSA